MDESEILDPLSFNVWYPGTGNSNSTHFYLLHSSLFCFLFWFFHYVEIQPFVLHSWKPTVSAMTPQSGLLTMTLTPQAGLLPGVVLHSPDGGVQSCGRPPRVSALRQSLGYQGPASSIQVIESVRQSLGYQGPASSTQVIESVRRKPGCLNSDTVIALCRAEF